MKLLKISVLLFAAASILFTGCKTNSIDTKIKTEADSVSYALGINIAASMKQGDLENLNVLALAKGLQDAYSEKENVMTNEEAVEFLNNFFAKDMERKATENLIKGQQFLEENAKNEGVIVDESGLQYKVLVEGDGPSPTAESMVKVHYHGTKIDGTVFDSSVEREKPAEFQLNRVIQGWTIGVQKMKVGSKYIFYIPSELAYGSTPRQGAIKPNEMLIFEVELLDIIEAKK